MHMYVYMLLCVHIYTCFIGTKEGLGRFQREASRSPEAHTENI